ncbi:MAG: DUF192 domain-containing protein [bacterium]|nr:DUF192 domain-containing protein [bacterium]
MKIFLSLIAMVFLFSCKEPVAESRVIYFENSSGKTPEISVEIADTELSRQHGLMFRRELCENCGMLFIFPDEDFRAFWMKDTYLSLDIIFIREDGQVINIANGTIPFSTRKIPSTAPAKYVLEVKAGDASKFGISPGAKLHHPG